MITQEKIRSCLIPTEEIKSDIVITQNEITQYESELKILRNDPHQNRLEIYMREGKISKRRDFVHNLTQILIYRKEV